tara:strand:- start:443 stop:757 length:315 start_codon:yes stop_codon:yes gene_type:complete
MKMKWHDDSEAFLLFGAELNKVIAALQYLSDKNPDVEGMNKFIQRLRNMSSYDQMLDKLIFKTARKLKEDPPKTKDEALTDSMTLDEILYRFELDLPKGKNGKN